MARKKKTPEEQSGFGVQPPEEPTVATPPVKPPAPAPHPPRPQPQEPKSVFPALEVSGLGTIARGQFRERLGFRRSPRAYDGTAVMVVSDEVRRMIEPEFRDLRERRRSPLVP